MKIDHINISAPLTLLKEVRDFYCQVLGLEDGFRPESNIEGFWLYFENKPLIHLAQSNKHFANERQGYFDHIAFQSTNLIVMIDTLKANNIKYTTQSFPEANMTQLFFKDPTGIGVEVNFIGEYSVE